MRIKVKTAAWLVMGGLLVILLITEVSLRNLHPNRVLTIHPGFGMEEVNSNKRRDHGYGTFKKPGVFRIVATGDSFAWGYGVKKIDDIFLMKLEKLLNAPMGRKYEIINGSRPGWNTADEYAWLKQTGANFSPDLIMVILFFNDPTRIPTNPMMVDLIRANRHDFDGQTLPVYNFVRYTILRTLITKWAINDYHSEYFRGKTELWEKWRKDVTAIRDLAENKKANLLFVVFPVLVDLDNDYCFQDIHDAVVAHLQTCQVETYSLLPAFIERGGKAESLWINENDAHPNAKAHEIVAKSLYKYLVDSDLLKK
jgi:lysophospholipase L1-like esterase